MWSCAFLILSDCSCRGEKKKEKEGKEEEKKEKERKGTMYLMIQSVKA